MGDLDDAIREHLELKRRHGASEEEVATKEREAVKSGALPGEPAALPDAPGELPDEPPAAAVAPPEPETRDEAPARAPEPSTTADELEPDEVLPEEALDAGLPAAEQPADVVPAPDWSAAELPQDPEEEGETVLEETPEFLEDMPEQDRLWFEQRPPKDFDFDD
jgi:hypothetical protein